MPTKPPTILLYGGNIDSRRNKGDALMLLTVVSRLRKAFPEAELVASRGSGAYLDRCKLGLYQLLFHGGRFSKRRITSWLMGRHRHEYGLRSEDDLSAVINFQGYRFADFGATEVQQDFNRSRSRQRNGVQYIYLPQAFGPFERPDVRGMVSEMLNSAALVCARDPQSAKYLREIGVNGSNVMQCPDMTIGFPDEPLFDANSASSRKTAYVIPNCWMLSRAGLQNNEAITLYARLISRIQDKCDAAGVRVLFIDHSPLEDASVIRDINSHLKRPLPVVDEHDPLKLKGLVGQSLFVFGSRYHSVVAALSQNVPAIGTSWAPKYEGLYADYEMPEWLLTGKDAVDQLDQLLHSLFDQGRYQALVARLAERNNVLKPKVASMWERVRQVLSRERPPR